ncbi:MAG: AsmA family protein [Nevskia sp.]
MLGKIHAHGAHRGRIAAAAAVLLVVILVLLWDWNWFKPLVEARASAALNRRVTIARLDVRPGAKPWILLDDVVVANPPDMTEGTLGSIGRLSVHIELWPLLRGRIVLPDLIVDRLRGDLRPAPSGKGNWMLDLPPADANAPPTSLEIGSLSIIDGSTHVLDPSRKADFAVLLHTENADAGDQARIIVTAEGVYAAQKVTAKLVGDALLELRDPSDPYRIEFTATNGATRIVLDGTLLDPLRFGGAKLALSLQGDDLSALFPLTGIPLPPTPAYKLKGALDYADRKFRFTDFSGTVGSSDLRGDLLYERRPDRPDITANLVSQKVLLADLAGFIGAPPGRKGAASDTDTHRRERERQEAKTSLLPDRPINLPKLRSADLHVSYKAERIETESTPLDDIVAVLDVVDGKLTLRPLSFGVGNGRISMNIALDGQQDQVHAVADVDFRKLDLSHILSKTTIFHGAGTVGGTAKIDSSGNSMKTLLGRGDGELKLFMTGGDISALLVDLVGIDLGNAVLSALGIPRRADLRCMVVDFGLKDGQVDTRTMLIDTTEANVIGNGAIDLKNEKIDYRLKTEPKHFNIGSLPAPILIRGDLKSPHVAPEAKALALRGAAAVALGVLLTPLGALIPTIQLGLGEDNDCVALLKTVGAPAAPPPPATKHKAGRSKKP